MIANEVVAHRLMNAALAGDRRATVLVLALVDGDEDQRDYLLSCLPPHLREAGAAMDLDNLGNFAARALCKELDDGQ
jgi:hypothetical protein